MSTTKTKIKEPIKTSVTVIIKRSQIRFAPYNPKRHSDEAIKLQKKNFKDIGFLGGVVWNKTTGNLVSGHKRVMAMDMIYVNTKENPVDYEVKVEQVELDPKQEKEQNIFMDARSTNTFQAYDLLAEILPEIDYKMAGLDQNELALISLESPFIATGKTEDIVTDFKAVSQGYEQSKEEKKAAVKEAKAEIKSGMSSGGASYITLSFDSYPNKCQFLERYGYNPDMVIIKGEQFLSLLNDKEDEEN